jgi:hypothetical protein
VNAPDDDPSGSLLVAATGRSTAFAAASNVANAALSLVGSAVGA